MPKKNSTVSKSTRHCNAPSKLSRPRSQEMLKCVLFFPGEGWAAKSSTTGPILRPNRVFFLCVYAFFCLPCSALYPAAHSKPTSLRITQKIHLLANIAPGRGSWGKSLSWLKAGKTIFFLGVKGENPLLVRAKLRVRDCERRGRKRSETDSGFTLFVSGS